MASSAYLRILIFLLAILIPAYASSIPLFLMMYSAYRLNSLETVNAGEGVERRETSTVTMENSVEIP